MIWIALVLIIVFAVLCIAEKVYDRSLKSLEEDK